MLKPQITTPKGTRLNIPAKEVKPGDFVVKQRTFFRVGDNRQEIHPFNPQLTIQTIMFSNGSTMAIAPKETVRVIRREPVAQKKSAPVDRKKDKRAKDREIRAAMKNGGRNK